ncbi:alpha/beta hydrolase [Phenylobacterium sp.]|jgi:acetyl esterase/lipase|uniref:alpha/beta hydrolase n=1 Tax=Phenylobacterium sp. TaxID=1871053 RepID=UPI002F936986
MADLDRRSLITLAAATPALAAATDPPDPSETVRLWPGSPPSAPAVLPKQEIVDRVATSGFRDRFVTGVGAPLMTVFRPVRPNGAAALIIPGGGYIRVVIDKEGFELAHRLTAAGVTSFVLRYRLPKEGWANAADAPLADAQQAMRILRARSTDFRIDPKRVLAIGFSAGGHVAASLAVRSDGDARPDLSALVYPVISMSRPHAHIGSREALLGASPGPEREAAYSPHLHVTAQAPPTFLVHAADDASVPLENSLAYLAALRAQKVPAEAHVFEEGGHGFGLRLIRGKPGERWPELLMAWAARRGWLA